MTKKQPNNMLKICGEPIQHLTSRLCIRIRLELMACWGRKEIALK